MGFKQLDDDLVVVIHRGVFRQCPLYARDGTHLFAEVSKGAFVRLNADGSTSKPDVRIDVLITDAPLWRDRFGRLAVSDGEKFKALSTQQTETLLLGSVRA